MQERRYLQWGDLWHMKKNSDFSKERQGKPSIVKFVYVLQRIRTFSNGKSIDVRAPVIRKIVVLCLKVLHNRRNLVCGIHGERL